MYYDIILCDYPRLSAETEDSARIMRAAAACPDGVLYIPKGDYRIAQPILITNGCSLLMHKSARLIAVAPMDFIITADCEYGACEHDFMGEAKQVNLNLSQFISGGVLDGAGLASCLKIVHYRKFKLSDIVCLNGKHYGLYAGGYYELICNNIYCKCTLNGLSGNIGICSDNGDSHYTDCIVVDYTTGIAMLGGGSNRLTRCHVWGGPVKPTDGETIPEMLKNSVCFRLNSEDTLLRDCYADTATVGYLIENDARLLGCAYFNNDYFGLDNIVAVKQTGGEALISECAFTKSAPHTTLYQRDGGTSRWVNNILRKGFSEKEIEDLC